MGATRYHGAGDLGKRVPLAAGVVGLLFVLGACAGTPNRGTGDGLRHAVPEVRPVPWLGAEVQQMTPALARTVGLPEAAGCVVTKLEPGGAGEKGGLRWGDVIVTVDGVRVDGPAELAEWSGVLGAKEAVLGILRGGQKAEIRLRLPGSGEETGVASVEGADSSTTGHAPAVPEPDNPPDGPATAPTAAKTAAAGARKPPERTTQPGKPAAGNDSRPMEELAFSLYRAGRLEEAAEAYRRALATSPDQAALWNNLGAILNRLGRPGEALEALDRALATEPTFAQAHLNRGHALWELGDRAGAIEAYDRATRADPELVAAWEALSVACLGEERWLDAAEAARAGMVRGGKSREFALTLGRALTALGRLEEAREAYEGALERFPDDPEILLEAAILIDQTGDPAGAVALLDRLIELSPSAAAFYNRALGRWHMGNVEGTVNDARRALGLQPDHVPARNLLAGALWQMGRVEEALVGWREALTWDPGNPGVLMALERAAREIGRDPEGIRRLQLWLGRAGLDPGPVDGVWGERTSAALRRFQSSRGLRPTGRVNGPTLAELTPYAAAGGGDG